LNAFEQRLRNDPAIELPTALNEIAAITRMRISKLFGAPSPPV
jgi:2-oxo-4-hydroxy-4-carboxy--5-ureidoimidazoline (OHCU) decarboxylase